MAQGRILPQGKTQFFDANGDPLALGQVFYYIPSTTTFKNTYQDLDQTILNTNPVALDAAGEAIIWGSGVYRQLVKDSLGNTVWDQVVSSPLGSGGIDWGGVGGGLPNAQSVVVSAAVLTDGYTFEYIPGVTNTGATTLTVNPLGSTANVFAPTGAGPAALNGGELTQGNVVRLTWVTSLGGWLISNGGRIAINTLATITDADKDDFLPLNQDATALDKKIRIFNFLRVVNNLDPETAPKKEDLLFWYSTADNAARQIDMETFWKVVNDLTEETAPSISDDFLPIYSDSATKGRKVSMQRISTWLFVDVFTVSSGDAFMRLLSMDLSRFRAVRLTLCTVIPETDDVWLGLQVSTDNGATWQNTGYFNPDGGATTNMFTIVLSTIPVGQKVSNVNADGGVNGTLILANCDRTSSRKTLTGTAAWKEPGSDVGGQVVTSISPSCDKVNALRFQFSSGGFKRGIVVVEGIPV